MLPIAVMSCQPNTSPPCQRPARTGTAPHGSDHGLLRSGVPSQLFVASLSTPCLHMYCTTERWPLSTAKCSGVLPSSHLSSYHSSPSPRCQPLARKGTATQGGGHWLLPCVVVSCHPNTSPPCQRLARTCTALQGGDLCMLHSAVVSSHSYPSPPDQPAFSPA